MPIFPIKEHVSRHIAPEVAFPTVSVFRVLTQLGNRNYNIDSGENVEEIKSSF